MAQIKHTYVLFTGSGALMDYAGPGLDLKNGEAAKVPEETAERLLDHFPNHFSKITEEQFEEYIKSNETPPPSATIQGMTKAQLMELIKEKGLEIPNASSMKVADLKSAVSVALGGEALD